MDSFKKDLKHILHSQGETKKSKKNDQKRYFNLKSIYPEE